jgi:hypothetical protein
MELFTCVLDYPCLQDVQLLEEKLFMHPWNCLPAHLIIPEQFLIHGTVYLRTWLSLNSFLSMELFACALDYPWLQDIQLLEEKFLIHGTICLSHLIILGS